VFSKLSLKKKACVRMNFRTETLITEDLYRGLANPKQMRRNLAFSAMIIAIIPIITIPSILDAGGSRLLLIDLFGLISGAISVFILQLPRLTIRRGIKKAQEAGTLNTLQAVEFTDEGIVKNDDNVIPYSSVLAILVTQDHYLLTSRGSVWTFVNRAALISMGQKAEFEKFLEQKCPNARWTQQVR